MAKSIFETLATMTTETSVKGIGDVEHTLPSELFPSDEIFENRNELLAWAEEHDYVHALLQQGIQKGLIDLRAKFRPTAKEEKDETWTPVIGQFRVNAHKWEIIERPKSGDKVKTAIDTLSKLSPEQLAEILAKLGK